MKNKFIKELYDRTINSILKDIGDKYVDQVKKGYMNYLIENYDEVYSEEDMYLLDDNISDEINYWGNQQSVAKLSSFVEDGKFKNLIKLSDESYNLAKKKLYSASSPISIDEAKIKIKQAEELLDEVESFNKIPAENLLSETTLDYQYASGISNDIMSLRLSYDYRLKS